MKIRTILLTVFTLAFFASVFLCGVTFAEAQTAVYNESACSIEHCTDCETNTAASYCATVQSVEPWNVIVDVVHENVVYTYDLRAEMQQYLHKSESRGFFLGTNGKITLYNQLLDGHCDVDAAREYVLPNFRQLLQKFRYVNVVKRDATVTFDKRGFSYTEGVDGISIDIDALFWKMLSSGGNHITVQLPTLRDKAVTVAELKQNTVRKGSFTTHFTSSGANRVHNIKVATNSLNGTTINVGEQFSFNEVVGKRTVENGYKQAKVISNGMYTDGVGGGVCQVSTTLYNALLLSEVTPRACQHTLISSYVMAGFDAMVSDGGADLTFVNEGDCPLYIGGKVNSDKSVTFTIYGKPNRYRIERESVEQREPYNTVEVVDRNKFPELVYTDQIMVVTSGSDGVKSQSYLKYYDGDRLVLRKLIRTNSYKKVDRVIAHGDVERETE